MKLITVLLPEAYFEGLDELVHQNMYSSRSDTIRVAVGDLLKRELWKKNKTKDARVSNMYSGNADS